MNTLVLLMIRDRVLTTRLEKFMIGQADDAVTLECVDHVSEAIQRLRRDDGVSAVAVDWDSTTATGVDALLALITAVPHLPVIVLGNDSDVLLQATMLAQGAQDYVLKRRLDAESFKYAVYGAIARKAREMRQSRDNERAQVTLNSIGDAILSTDGEWRITFLNPVAEKLIGWTSLEAIGRPLTEVFQVIDATTGAHIVPSLEFAVGKGRTYILPLNCVLVRRDGHKVAIEDSAAPIHDRNGRVTGLVVVFHDVSEAQAVSQRMTHLARHDILTSLPNRALLDDRLDQGIALARRHNRRLAVLFIDLDHFKHINDSLGHLIGDQLLKAVALRITPCVRSSDTVSRQGGDEFIVLLSEIAHAEDAAIIAEKIRLAVFEPCAIANHLLQLTTSIGVSIFPEDGADAETLIQGADTAMYHAKETGRNNCQFFKEELNTRSAQRQIITGELRLALMRREFFLVYQPKISLVNGAITGVEALLRWQHPSRGVLPPAEFMHIAEDCGLIIQIGQWVLKAACVQAKAWLTVGLKFGTMAVNISAVEFRNDRFFENVRNTLESTGLGALQLELELTETAVMRDFEGTSVVLQALSRMGIRIAVDDFGTGYSNLSYLKRFPINTLKLDKSFVNEVPENPHMATIVRSVIHMGRSLQLNVIAEGVENAKQVKFLQAYGCAEAQGYYFSRPVEADECRSLLSQVERRGAWQLSSPTLRAFK